MFREPARPLLKRSNYKNFSLRVQYKKTFNISLNFIIMKHDSNLIFFIYCRITVTVIALYINVYLFIYKNKVYKKYNENYNGFNLLSFIVGNTFLDINKV